MVSKEISESYYAFNIDKKKGRLLNQKSLNFDNLNKGFYDDLINYDEIIRKDKNELGEKKKKGIKELVYSYKKIPEVWTNKLTYTNELYKTMKDDQNFLSYLGGLDKNPKNYYSPMKTTSTNVNSDFSMKNYSIKEKEKENIEKNKEKEKEEKNSQNEDKIIITQINNNNHKYINTDAGTNRDIILLLEEYKNNFPIYLPSIPTKIPTVEEAKKIGQSKINDDIKEELNKFNDNSKENSFRKSHLNSINNSNNNSINNSINNYKNNSLNLSLRKKKGELTKEEVFKTTIFNNLLPPEGSKNYISKRVKDYIEVDLKKYISNNSEDLYKKIEITNPEVKKRLQDINYWGPFYPYCFIGRNNNMRFYQTMEPNQCIKLLNYIKKVKIKNRIKYE